MAAFQMLYSHAIGQYSAVSMLMLFNMLENSKVSWYEEHVEVKYCSDKYIYIYKVKASV